MDPDCLSPGAVLLWRRKHDHSLLQLVVYVADRCGSVQVLYLELHCSLLCGAAADLQSCTCREGEDGDNFWTIESGIYKAVKQAPQDGERLLFRYEGKGAFGELALMYNCPRAATVVVNSRPPAVVHCYSSAWCMPSVHFTLWLRTSAGGAIQA